MTVIAVKITKNEIVIGADSGANRGSTIFLTNKIFTLNDVVLAGTGVLSEIYCFKQYLRKNKMLKSTQNYVSDYIFKYMSYLKKEIIESDEFSACFILVVRGKVYYVHSYSVILIKRYFSIGSGCPEAMALLSQGISVRKTISVVCNICNYCSTPVKIKRIHI